MCILPVTDQQSLLEFPCDFPIKAMGLANDDFADQVLALVRRHAPDTQAHALTSRPSSAGKYLAVTITIRATSRSQLDAIYQDLTDSSAVVMAL